MIIRKIIISQIRFDEDSNIPTNLNIKYSYFKYYIKWSLHNCVIFRKKNKTVNA